MGDFFFIQTRIGVPSLAYREGTNEFKLHSTYNPIEEAKKYIESRKEEIKSARYILVYGLGLGYHIQVLEKYRQVGTKVYVFEMNPDILSFTKEVFSINEFEDKGYHFYISNNFKKIRRALLEVLQKFELEESLLLIHRPSLKTIPECCTPIKDLLEEWEIKRDSFSRNKVLMENNFRENVKNLKDYFLLDSFFHKITEVPIIIVSAGPSLNKNINHLSKAKGKALIIAVGSVVKPLLKGGITPDCIVISDPLPGVYQQISGLDIDIPLFFLPTIEPKIVADYKGPKIILFQKGFTLSEILAEEHGLHLIETGGSVATTALEMALFFGGNPIIFVGQDLAYTGGKTHTEGTVHNDWVPKTNIRKVKGIDGFPVATSRNLSIYRRWIEDKIRSNPQHLYLNATEGGAHIVGTQVVTLKEVLQRLQREYPIKAILEGLFTRDGG